MKKEDLANNHKRFHVEKEAGILPEAFLQEFESLRPPLKSYLFRITAHREDTEDLLQETYIKASGHLSSFEQRSSLKTWIFAIATNLAKDHLRAKARWPLDAMDQARAESMKHPEVHMARFMEINQSEPNGAFELREHINFCFTCIGKTLPLEQQVAVLLKEILDFKITEIALILGKTEGVAKHLLLDARKTMQQVFDQRCSLISKNGACHQCSELNGLFNPKQNFQQEKLKAGFEDPAQKKNHRRLLKLRTNLAKAIHPYHCNGSDLQFFHFEHINKVLGTNALGKD